MKSSIHSAITLIVSQVMCLTGAYFGNEVLESTGQFWHFLVLLSLGITSAFAFIECMNLFVGVDNDHE